MTSSMENFRIGYDKRHSFLIDSCRINDSNFEDYLPLMEHTHGIILSRHLVFAVQFPVTITLNNDSVAIT